MAKFTVRQAQRVWEKGRTVVAGAGLYDQHGACESLESSRLGKPSAWKRANSRWRSALPTWCKVQASWQWQSSGDSHDDDFDEDDYD